MQAVRHLPASKQEEYRRLKQRIAEREQQNMNRNIQISTKNSAQTASVNEGTSTADANDTILAKIPQTSSDASCKPVTVQTRIGESALELLRPEIKKDISDDNDCVASPSLLPDIPIKTEASILEATSIAADNNSKVNSIIANNLNKDESELNLMSPIAGPMTNLTIQFPNTNDNSVPFVRHISIGRNDNAPKEQTINPKSPPHGLRILTTDQLNMKYEYPPTGVNEDATQIEDSKAALNAIIEINNDKDTTPAHNTIESMDNNLIDSSITVETCKIETNCDNTEWSMSNYQTTVDSKVSTTISSQNDSSIIIVNNDRLDTTAELDSTILLNSTVVEDNIDAISDQTLNIQSALSYEDLNTETKVLAQKSLDKIELDVEKQLETIYNLPDNEQRIQLTTVEKDLVAKR